MARGYYKLPEKTAESFFEEHGIRWFRTGDIGEMCPNGNVRIVGQSGCTAGVRGFHLVNPC